MLNKKFLISALFLFSSSLYAKSEIDANLKRVGHTLSFQFVNVSKTDVNRIVCENGEIGKIVYSKDKEISIQKDGENAFVKLLPVTTRSNGVVVNTLINDFVRDVYIECNKKMYSLNLTPSEISAQTILLFDNGTKKENPEAKKFEKANSFEKTMLDIIKSVYKDKEPDGYIVKNLNANSIKFDELELLPTKTYSGNDYMVYEYKITAHKDMELEERMFVNFIASNPLALTLTELNLSKGKEARLLVVANATPDPITFEEKKQVIHAPQEVKEKNEDKQNIKSVVKEEIITPEDLK